MIKSKTMPSIWSRRLSPTSRYGPIMQTLDKKGNNSDITTISLEEEELILRRQAHSGLYYVFCSELHTENKKWISGVPEKFGPSYKNLKETFEGYDEFEVLKERYWAGFQKMINEFLGRQELEEITRTYRDSIETLTIFTPKIFLEINYVEDSFQDLTLSRSDQIIYLTNPKNKTTLNRF